MGKRHAADSENQFETPQKRQKVASHAVSFAETPTSSPALNVSFTLTREFVDGTILTDLTLKDWRIGKPIGKGSFGEIFLASDDVFKPVTSQNAKYVVKIEPHSNGPLFVEIHALLNTAKASDSNVIPPGMPEYIASGSHYFKNERYRFLILKRYQRDLHSLIKNRRIDPKSVPVIACQILDVLEHLHDKGYVHSDIKAENLMLGKVPISQLVHLKSTKLLASGKKALKHKTATSNGYNGLTSTPTVMTKKFIGGVEFSGSNPVRSCRGNGTAESETYQDMIKSHYLRPLKNIVYRDDSDEEDTKNGKKKGRRRKDGDTSKSFFYKVTTKNVSENYKQIDVQISRNGAVLSSNGTCEAKVENGKGKRSAQPGTPSTASEPQEERIHLIDFGLASKFVDSTGQHRPFCMDQRRAHDGTLEFTSRDAHMGAHARRSDLECLGYNLIFWSRGFLPWKDEKLLNQPEQVHRMKEYFMTDVREMLKMIYGEECPKYLGEFLHYVGGLTYDERPDYDYLRDLFYQELRRLGCKPKSHLKLKVDDIIKHSQPLTAHDEAEITNKINHVKSLMKMGVLPYRESTLHNKTTSPKNLRSKRDSTRTPANGGKTANGQKNGSALVGNNGKESCKKEKKFSWSEILSTDPDQIARERAEKEFERADQIDEVIIKYSGNPTYAIRELENKRNYGTPCGGLDYTESEDYIKGYTKPMMEILRKRQSQLLRDIGRSKSYSNGVKEPPDNSENDNDETSEANVEDGEDNVEDDEVDSEASVSESEEDEEEVEANEKEEEEQESDDAATEADSGNDDVDGEEEEEEEEQEPIHAKKKSSQDRKEDPRKLGRKPAAAQHPLRKVESDSDFINDAEELEDATSNDSDVMKRTKRNDRRKHFQSESSEQHDSDFNDQESSEYDSRDVRNKKSRGRPRLNRVSPMPGQKQTYSKANGGPNTKVPVIARNNNNNNNTKPYYGDVDDSSHDVPLQQHRQQQQQQQQQNYRLVKRRKSGLRERIRPTVRSIKYHDALEQKKSKRISRKRYSHDEDYCHEEDDASCSSTQTLTSEASSASISTTSMGSDFSEYLHAGSPKRKSSRKRKIRTYSNSSRSALSSHSRSSSVHNVAAATNGGGGGTMRSNGIYGHHRFVGDDDEFFDDDDTRDMDYSPVKPKRARKLPNSGKSASLKKKSNEGKGSFSLV
ncbi:uncharacterized protein LOC131438053 isoform X2 [Malaya genurostris]|uniref:uncharacterized protein LOC131438053 isoform X2 n=1 Tax=Malaya genurostris TaxID=325434 RepID=UPI0026F3AE27|nr:uncharacterized protein LOC131438053 isoform X2 [Malaya genurostris]